MPTGIYIRKLPGAKKGKHYIKCSLAKLNEKNPMWKGNKASYGSIHDWIRKRLPKPKLCECCNKKRPVDMANISQKYKRDLTDWEWLCRKCHMTKDGRIYMNLKDKSKYLEFKIFSNNGIS